MDKKPLPIEISDFRRVIEGGYAYADKTLFVQELVERGTGVALIPRPRRFGKTLNLSMLRYFFEKGKDETSHLFRHLRIWQHEKFREMQGKFPVIFLTFKDVKHSSWEKTFEHFCILLAEEFQRHSYLLESDALAPEEQADYRAILRGTASQILCEQSLRLLTKWLHDYHKTRVVILIDEYDAPAHAAYIGHYSRSLIEFLRNFLSGGLKDNSSLERGVLTGILRIAKESIFSGLNNITTHSLFSDTFQDKFGMTQEDVKELLTQYALSERIDEITRWYDGYRMGTCAHMYNPWSVLNCIANRGALSPYWVNTSDNALVKQLITKGSGELKSDLEELLRGSIVEKKVEEGFVFADLEEKPGVIWALLLFSGYLTLERSVSWGEPCRLSIPNAEVRALFQSTVLDWFERSLHDYKYRMLLDSLIQGDVDTFSQLFQEFVLSSASIFDVSGNEPEKIYHAFILGMLIGLKDHEVKSNRESGLGRYDVMIIPKNAEGLGIIMEFKTISRFKKMDLETAAQSALKQIEEKQYARELLDCGIRKILCLAFAFEGKDVLILPKFLP